MPTPLGGRSNIDQVSDEAIFSIGKVVSVKGRTVEVKVDKTKNASHLVYKGDLLRNVAVGSYIKIVKGFTRIIGKVDGEEITEDKLYAARKDYTSGREKIDRVLTVSLLGFFKGNEFERGIKELPLIDNECYLLQNEEFEQVHDFITKGDEPLVIGTLSFEKGQEIRVGVNSLFASHIAIFGNTGSGKSYTLAKIYRELFLRYIHHQNFKNRARFFLIDFNGEYTADEPPDDVIIEEAHKSVYRLSTHSVDGRDRLPVTVEAVNDAEFWAVLLEATPKTQTPFLRRAIESHYLADRVRSADGLRTLITQVLREGTVEVDRAVERGVAVNFLKELNTALGGNASIQELIADYEAHLKYHTTAGRYYYQADDERIVYSNEPEFVPEYIEDRVVGTDANPGLLSNIDRIRLQIIFQYYSDIVRGFSNKEHLAPLIKRLDQRIDSLKKVIRVGAAEELWNGRNIAVVSLKDVNMQMRKVLPLLFCKRLYNDKKVEDDSETYLNIIVDEAHNILSQESERESEQWKDYRLETFEEMVKEGRKFGVFLTIASQRPSDISPTIVSQMHNYFLHRLINNEDIHAVRQTISYLDKVSFEYVPLLPTGTCILAGLLANVPIVIDVGKIEPKKHEPRNKTITLTDKWD
ncbi:MAG TPA: ATP-binding protein [Terriglobales bacterium]